MSEKGNHITDLFRRYLRGDISRIDQQALDKEVLEDAYVRDAKEGIDQLSKVNVTESVNNLDARLKARFQKDKSKKGLGWMSMAAGIAILVAAGILIWKPFADHSNVASNESTPAIEMQDNSVMKRASKSASSEVNIGNNVSDFIVTMDEQSIGNSQDQDTPVEINRNWTSTDTEDKQADTEVDVNVSAKQIAQAEANTFSRQKKSKPFNQPTDDIAIKESANRKSSAKSQIIPKKNEINSDASVSDIVHEKEESLEEFSSEVPFEENGSDVIVANEKAAPAVRAAPNANAKTSNTKVFSNSDAALKTITGVVQDDTGEFLIGANVVVTNTTIGTITDVDGSFEIEVPAEVNELSVHYTGFESLVLVIPSNNKVIAQMDSQNLAMDEVVVLGYSTAAEKQENKTYAASTPIDGNSAFKKYIKSNLVYPLQASDASVKGKVVLLFNVDGAGTPIDIEVKKSLGYGCDEEAMRLLRDGPKWTQGTLSEKNSISIRFR